MKTARTNTLKRIEEWKKDWYESRQDYPVTKSKKKLTWAQIRKLIKLNKS